MSAAKKKGRRSRWANAAGALADRQRASLPPMPDGDPVAVAAWMRENAMTMSEFEKKWPEHRKLYGKRLKSALDRQAGRTSREKKYDAIYRLVAGEVQGTRPKWKALARKLADKHGQQITPEQLRKLVLARVGMPPG
jgi:hypothetical protein